MQTVIVNFTPSVNKILFRRDKKAEVTQGGIIIPSVKQDETTVVKGTVLAAGKIDGEHAIEYKKGDRILVTRFGGADMQFDTNHGEETLTVIDQVEILGILSNERTTIEYVD
jgi:co-chaperonin GroES (HSP10)